MANETPARPAEPSSARLLIFRSERASAGTGLLAALQARWRLLADRLGLRTTPARTRVRVDDLQGRRFYACNDATSLIAMDLPPGTYHITVRLGGLQRRYTVALDRGATFNLRLPADAARL